MPNGCPRLIWAALLAKQTRVREVNSLNPQEKHRLITATSEDKTNVNKPGAGYNGAVSRGKAPGPTHRQRRHNDVSVVIYVWDGSDWARRRKNP